MPAVRRPFFLQIARRHGYLVGGGGDGGVEADPVRVVADVGVRAGLLVAQLRHPRHFGGESIFAAVVAVGELLLGLVAELRHHGVVEEGAVVGEETTFRTVGETLRRIFQREVEIHRRARRQRGLQPVDGVAELLVHAHCVVRCERQRLQSEAVGVVHVQFADRCGGLVDQGVVAADIQPALIWVDIHVRFHRGDARLRQVLVLRVLLLVVGVLFRLCRAALVVVEHVGVVVDPDAAADECQPCSSQCDLCRCVQARPSFAQPVRPGLIGAAHPEQCGQHQQRHGAAGPVEVKPQRSLEEMAETVHVRIRHVRRTAVVVQVMVPMQQAEADRAEHQPHDGQQITEELVVRHHLQEQRQHCQQHERDRIQGQCRQIQAQLQMGIAVAQLPADAHHGANQQKRCDHRQQRAQLGDQRHPVRYRKRVADLGRVLAAFAPYQFAGIERDDDVQQPLEAAMHAFQHLMRHRPGGGAIDLAGQRQREKQIEQAQRQHDQERHAAQHAECVERKLRAQLRQVRPQVGGQSHPGHDQRGGMGLRKQHWWFRPLLASRQLQTLAIGPEQRHGGPKHDHADGAPQQSVEQQHAG